MTLLETMKQLEAADELALSDAARDFVEVVTFAPSEEILTALRQSLADDWMSLPVWARNLAYRLACLQDPDNAELLREAATDLVCFGPDWDTEAESMRARAERLPPTGRSS
ncbi:hypothetical protein [Antribacter gilvus]|uniref:hypothetical protein n=1 Tax=Antribacter gilvus TaxID=2304675 RepID=UPI00197E6E87|nr:hypothetical protein [Antribacter gilvus]